MVDESALGSTVAKGVGLLASVAIGAAVIKGVTSAVGGLTGEDKNHQKNGGVKKMESFKVKSVKIPKLDVTPKKSGPKIPKLDITPKKTDFRVPKAPTVKYHSPIKGFKAPKVDGPKKANIEGKFVPDKSDFTFKFKPFKVNTKVGY